MWQQGPIVNKYWHDARGVTKEKNNNKRKIKRDGEREDDNLYVYNERKGLPPKKIAG